MKIQWICKWQLIPGGKTQTEIYPTREAARKAMAKILGENINLTEYIRALRNEEGDDCIASADFLEDFLSGLALPESDDEIPPHLDVPDRCFLEISTEVIRWDYRYKQRPSLVAGYMFYEDDHYPFVVDFSFENPSHITPKRPNALWIEIDEHLDYGTSAYPLMVSLALEETPKTIDKIIRTIQDAWKTFIDRKAVGRHLRLLQDLGFGVQHSREGYYWGNAKPPKAGAEFKASAYPLMILQVLDDIPKTQTQIISAVQEKYGVTMDRRAVSRNINMLNILSFSIEHSPKGYYTVKKEVL